MPELPEVETIVRELTPRLTGRHFLTVEVLHPRITRFSRCDLAGALTGRRIEGVRRRGKFILLDLDHGCLTVHLGMTGQLLFDAVPGPHTRALFHLDDSVLLYDDARMFGALEWDEEPRRAAALGPDALAGALDPAALRRRAPIKAILLNQTVFSGIGNIYADESLFRAGIDPRRHGDRISTPRLKRLLDEIRAVLAEAVDHRGSSVSDYVDTAGRKGGFQALHRVYDREGLACNRCGNRIRRIVVAGRGTHFCPLCQR